MAKLKRNSPAGAAYLAGGSLAQMRKDAKKAEELRKKAEELAKRTSRFNLRRKSKTTAKATTKTSKKSSKGMQQYSSKTYGDRLPFKTKDRIK